MIAAGVSRVDRGCIFRISRNFTTRGGKTVELYLDGS